jgi:hypothetical protein
MYEYSVRNSNTSAPENLEQLPFLLHTASWNHSCKVWGIAAKNPLRDLILEGLLKDRFVDLEIFLAANLESVTWPRID